MFFCTTFWAWEVRDFLFGASLYVTEIQESTFRDNLYAKITLNLSFIPLAMLNSSRRNATVIKILETSFDHIINFFNFCHNNQPLFKQKSKKLKPMENLNSKPKDKIKGLQDITKRVKNSVSQKVNETRVITRNMQKKMNLSKSNQGLRQLGHSVLRSLKLEIFSIF